MRRSRPVLDDLGDHPLHHGGLLDRDRVELDRQFVDFVADLVQLV